MAHRLTTMVTLALASTVAFQPGTAGFGDPPPAAVTAASDPTTVVPTRPASAETAVAEAILSSYLTFGDAVPDRERGVAEMRRALRLARDGDAYAAVAAFRRSAELYPPLRDWSFALAADAAARIGDVAAVESLLRETEPWLAAEWGWRARARAHREAADMAGALAAADRAAATLADPARRAEATAFAARLRLQTGDTTAAGSGLRDAIAIAPQSTAALDAAQLLASLPGLSADERMEIGRLFVRRGRLQHGLAELDAAAAATRSPEVRAAARLEAGRALFQARRYAEAERRLVTVAADAGSPPHIAAEALFIAGRSQFRQGRAPAARATFRHAADRFPDEAAAADALFILADLAHEAGELDDAREYYRRAIAIRPERPDAVLAAVRLGGLAYLDRDFPTAAAVLEETRRHHSDGRHFQQATYWAAKAQLGLGRDDAARELLSVTWETDPFSYYGLRAAELLDGRPRPLPVAGEPRLEPTLDAEVAAALDRLDALREAGAGEAGSLENERMRVHFAARHGGLYALAEALHRRGATFDAILLGRDIHRREGAWNARLLRIVYPFPYRDLILRESRRNGLDPYLVAGLIRQESMWNPTIASSAGAIGLMQIMPATGRELARRTGIRGYQTPSLRNPEINVRLGTFFLADLLRRYDGSVVEALAAYNAGPGRVARWRAFPEARYTELFAERIPLQETRDYVRIVQQNARLYSEIYAD